MSEICKFPVGYYTIIDKLQQRFSMDFFLVRHGEAEPEHRDRRRPLTPDGRREVEKIARAAAARRLKIAEILHSEKLRAKETAESSRASFLPPGESGNLRGFRPKTIRCRPRPSSKRPKNP